MPVNREYETWRAEQIRTIGGKIQREAEANLEKHMSQPFTEVLDHRSESVKAYRQDVAQSLVRKGKASPRRLTFSVPLIPGFTDAGR